MKTTSRFFLCLFSIVFLCAFPVHAQREFFGQAGVFYASPSANLSGGGISPGLEYINEKTHWGVGARILVGFQFGDEELEHLAPMLAQESATPQSQCDIHDVACGLDLYVPARLFDWLTVYGGGGVAFHAMTIEFDYDLPTSWGWIGRKYEGESDFPDCITGSFFAGGRLHVAEHFFLFGEYRRVAGDVKIEFDEESAGDGFTYDMSGNRFLVGVGVYF